MSIDNAYKLLAGHIPQKTIPAVPFSPIVQSFIADFRTQLLKNPSLSPDWKSLAFWLRPQQIKKWQTNLQQPQYRLGRGLSFHIPPSNIPTVFAYSFLLSLLSGNGNIIRISPRIYNHAQQVITILQTVLQQPQYAALKQQNAFILYDKDPALTAYFSRLCDCRILWGSDTTLTNIRQIPLPPHAIELVFRDRSSIAIIYAQTLLQLSPESQETAIHHFYMDTYHVDQNGCASPQIIIWLGTPQDCHQAKKIWWSLLAQKSSSYKLTSDKVTLKYNQLWKYALSLDIPGNISTYTNFLYVYTLSTLPQDISTLRGISGLFFEIEYEDIHEFWPHVNKKIQTVTTFAKDIKSLRRQVIEQQLSGIDRIVPFGQALTMDIIWDGIHIIDTLSRYIY
ncbi:acyl-CoA reductase [uncultured Megasphaera sp.]|uniref:acyl-CoA reductase n=1 Tax=uncultured Megasphaera sp. TaxID=165188 RepID=UPI0025930CBD|nr:acyl-CoA reductase [uncultured Megasphaera sp.]